MFQPISIKTFVLLCAICAHALPLRGQDASFIRSQPKAEIAGERLPDLEMNHTRRPQQATVPRTGDADTSREAAPAEEGRQALASDRAGPWNHSTQPASRKLSYLWLRLLVCGLLVGSVFGMMGAGGAMITKPMLYYVFHQRPFKWAIFNMYVILLFLAFFGAALGCQKGLVVWPHVAMLFLFTSLLGTTMGAMVVQFIPSEVQLLLFAALIITVAGYMWYRLPSSAQAAKGRSSGDAGTCASSGTAGPRHEGGDFKATKQACHLGMAATLLGNSRFIATATGVGFLCGSLGVGGGFMLTPLLCHLGHEMDSAVPTSLAVIFLSSCVGSNWYMRLFDMSISSVDYTVSGSLVLVGCLGMSVSGRLAALVTSTLRQKIYAGILFALGCGTFAIEGVAHYE